VQILVLHCEVLREVSAAWKKSILFDFLDDSLYSYSRTQRSHNSCRYGLSTDTVFETTLSEASSISTASDSSSTGIPVPGPQLLATTSQPGNTKSSLKRADSTPFELTSSYRYYTLQRNHSLHSTFRLHRNRRLHRNHRHFTSCLDRLEARGLRSGCPS